ncbi:hypothetical protein ACGFZG_25000 [Streptomyces antibioticus]|uniref:hypothetical protein n=1 Tax=Streptomyces antibioticus TaxID=1890 RepID=UPI00371CCEC2
MNVDDVIAERIAAAKWRAAQKKKRRAELAEARRAGLAARHAQKLRHIAEGAVDNSTLAASSV